MAKMFVGLIICLVIVWVFKANYGGYKYVFTVRQLRILDEVIYMREKHY